MDVIDNLGTLLFCFVVCSASIVFLVLHFILPAQDDPSFSAWPSPLFLLTQIIVSMILPRSDKKKQGGMAIISAAIEPPIMLDRTRLTRFRHLVGHASKSQDIPLLYPVTESFRLMIQSMLLPSFPFSILGSVLLKSRLVMLRPLTETEKLGWRVKINPSGIRSTVKGDSEIDIHSIATDSEGLVVWKSVVTVIVLGRNRNKISVQAPPPVVADRREIDIWSLDGSVGRRYGMISGDLNPIHVHWTLSRLFGFKRPIAHALFLVSKAEACIRSAGIAPLYPCIIETEFKRPTLLPAKLSMMIEEDAGSKFSNDDAVAWSQRAGSETGLGFAVTTALDPKISPGQKDVIVGRLWQGKSAMKKAA